MTSNSPRHVILMLTSLDACTCFLLSRRRLVFSHQRKSSSWLATCQSDIQDVVAAGHRGISNSPNMYPLRPLLQHRTLQGTSETHGRPCDLAQNMSSRLCFLLARPASSFHAGLGEPILFVLLSEETCVQTLWLLHTVECWQKNQRL